ncbi:hypothetical protein Q3G72_025917 [Acer saccharum]|nr:hypothetical protein Q3G72_025917 [Acer saccharum]
MEDVFMFATQPESDTTEMRKEKPPDFRNTTKRARSQEVEEGHSKEFCKDGVEEKEEVVNQAEVNPKGGNVESEPFGPWMQVSYGRNYRTNMGYRAGNRGYGDGKKSGNYGTDGKTGAGPQQRYEIPGAGEDVSRQVMEQSNSMGKVRAVRSVETSVMTSNISKLKAKKPLKKCATKYLVDTNTAKNISKPSKENFIEKGPRKNGKAVKKKYQQTVSGQQGGMEDNLDDSEVLQSLHKDLVEVERIEKPHTDITNTVPLSNDNQVDVAGDLPFNDIASNLKEAMAMTVE